MFHYSGRVYPDLDGRHRLWEPFVSGHNEWNTLDTKSQKSRSSSIRSSSSSSRRRPDSTSTSTSRSLSCSRSRRSVSGKDGDDDALALRFRVGCSYSVVVVQFFVALPARKMELWDAPKIFECFCLRSSSLGGMRGREGLLEAPGKAQRWPYKQGWSPPSLLIS